MPKIPPFSEFAHVQLTGAGWCRVLAERRAERAKLYRMFGLEPPPAKPWSTNDTNGNE